MYCLFIVNALHVCLIFHKFEEFQRVIPILDGIFDPFCQHSRDVVWYDAFDLLLNWRTVSRENQPLLQKFNRGSKASYRTTSPPCWQNGSKIPSRIGITRWNSSNLYNEKRNCNAFTINKLYISQIFLYSQLANFCQIISIFLQMYNTYQTIQSSNLRVHTTSQYLQKGFQQNQ